LSIMVAPANPNLKMEFKKRYILTVLGVVMGIVGLGLFFLDSSSMVVSGILIVVGAIIMGGLPKWSSIVKAFEVSFAILLIGLFALIAIYHGKGMAAVEETTYSWLLGGCLLAFLMTILRALLDN